MSTYLGNKLISGVSRPDGSTVDYNNNGKLQSIGTVNKNTAATSPLKFWTGTRQEYTNIEKKDPSTLYNIMDDAGEKAAEGMRKIGEIVTSALPLTDAGLHLIDGALISGSGSYSAFVDYIADLYSTSTKYSNVTTVGALVDNNGVLSGFSGSNYAILPSNVSLGSNFEIMLKVTTGSDVTSSNNLWTRTQNNQNTGLNLAILNGVVRVWISSNGSSYDIASDVRSTLTLNTNTTYYIRVTYDGSTYLIDVSTDKATWTNYISVSSSSTPSTYTPLIGSFIGETNTYWRGSYDLNECYINVNGSRWWSGRMASGFTEESAWQSSVSTYGVCGKFVYDSVNNTVRLPKITGIVEGTTDLAALGDLVEAGLPSISHTHSVTLPNVAGNNATWSSAAWGGDDASYRNSTATIGSMSSVNSIYGKSTTVQPQTIKALYYIVISAMTKTDIQVDIDEIATDLNGKADTDLANLNNVGKSKVAHNAAPSDTYIDLTLGASNTTYEAPADGWFYLTSLASGSSGYFRACVEETGATEVHYGSTTRQMCAIIHVRKGQNLLLVYSAFDTSTTTFRFIYAVGSESEAE